MHKTISRLDQLIDKQASKYRDKIAIKHGLRTFTYIAVSQISNQLSQFFLDQDIVPGDIIGVAIDRSPEMVITLLALIKAGLTYLPIDSKLPIDRINYMLNDCGAKALITSKDFVTQHKPETKVIFIEDAWDQYTSYGVAASTAEIDEDTPAYILYTSGSTGNPKGVEIKHSGLLNLLLSVQVDPGMDDSDIILATTTISFDIAELELFLPLISGGLLIMANAEVVRDGRLLIELAKSEKVTIMQGTPFMWRTMLEAGWDEVLPIKVFCGGEAMAKDLAHQLLKRSKSVWNMYGPTETTIYSIIKKVSLDDDIITIGKPILNTQVYILDEELNQVPFGEVGEICIGGTGVARGYINKPELTKEKFINDPFSSGTGQLIYKTGDLGKMLDNGEIHCLGRMDHQIKIRGFRIESEEIEFKLKQQEDIKDAIVTLFKDALENMHLVAYVVPESDLTDKETAIQTKVWKDKLKESLPEYMIPDHFMVIPSIPLMTNGKVDRKSLPAPALSKSLINDYEAPQTETEIILAEICLKNIALHQIGVTDNFFELGIDSLVALKIMIQVEKRFGKRIPVSTLINYPTIKQLAWLLENDYSAELLYKSLVVLRPNGHKIPLYIVHGIGLNVLNLYNMVSNLDDEQPVYGLQALGLDGSIEPLDNMEAIAKAYVDEIIKHNPTGPYMITGYSFGGYIAYEMVRQLLEMGKEVKMLGMFDTNVQYPSHQFPLGQKILVKTIRQFHKLKFRIGTLITYPALTFSYLKAYYSNKLNLTLNKEGYVEDYDDDNLPDFMQRIAEGLNVAFANYKMKPYDIKIDLFKAGTRLYYVDDPKTLGWGKYALKGVSIHDIPGDHKEIFSPPNDRILAEVLQNMLDQKQ